MAGVPWWLDVPVIVVDSDTDTQEDQFAEASPVIDLPVGTTSSCVIDEEAAAGVLLSSVATDPLILRENAVSAAGRRPLGKPAPRWGRCATCGRALRPFVTFDGKAMLICPNSKKSGGHSRRCLTEEEVVVRNFPLRFLRRVRVSF